MSTWKHMLTATAVMTLHAMALSTLASGNAHGSTVYRCPTLGGSLSYQAHPCDGNDSGRTSMLRVKDPRTAEQLAQSLDIRRRDGFDTAMVDAPASPKRKGVKKRSRKTSRASGTKASRTAMPTSQPIALSRHRTGERPFEHVGTPLSDDPPTKKAGKAKPRRASRSPAHFTARAPAPAKQAPAR